MIREIVIAVRTWIRHIAQWPNKLGKHKNIKERKSTLGEEIESKISIESSDMFSAPKPIDSSDVLNKGDDTTVGDTFSDLANVEGYEKEEKQISTKPSGDVLDGIEKDDSGLVFSPTGETETEAFEEVRDGFTALGSTNSPDDSKTVEEILEPSGTASREAEKSDTSHHLESKEEMEAKDSGETRREFSAPSSSGLSGIGGRTDVRAKDMFSDLTNGEQNEDEVALKSFQSSGLGVEGIKGEKSLSIPTVRETVTDDARNTSSDFVTDWQSCTETIKKKPREIGGRRTARGNADKSLEKKDHLRISKPELVCREIPGERKWGIFLSLPEEISDMFNLVEVRNNGNLLPVENGECSLSDFSGSVTITYSDGKYPDSEIPLFDGKTPLIFKSKNNWKGGGRGIKALTKGYFIVFAPEWKRKIKPSNSPERCVDPNMLAHFFQVGSTGSVDGFEECEVTLSDSGFSLQGICVVDDSEDGDLFVGEPPGLITAPEIVYGRVGEETQDGWKGDNFVAGEASLKKVMNAREGRFFVRVYNKDVNLIDSGNFRYCANLHEIRMNNKPYSSDMILVPSSQGHLPVTLQFVATNGTSIVPEQIDNSFVTVKPDGTIKVEPSCPENDKTVWILSSDRGTVEVAINLPRVWWKLECVDNSSEWLDKPLVLTREEFRTHAEENAKIQLCLPSGAENIFAGFNDDLAHKIRSDGELPLENFTYTPEIENPLGEEAELKIQYINEMITLVRVSPDTPPQLLESSTSPMETSSTSTYFSGLSRDQSVVPLAQVNRACGGIRSGKGFSSGELVRAGLTVADAKRMGVRIDHRRRSILEINVDALTGVRENA